MCSLAFLIVSARQPQLCRRVAAPAFCHLALFFIAPLIYGERHSAWKFVFVLYVNKHCLSKPKRCKSPRSDWLPAEIWGFARCVLLINNRLVIMQTSHPQPGRAGVRADSEMCGYASATVQPCPLTCYALFSVSSVLLSGKRQMLAVPQNKMYFWINSASNKPTLP